MPSLASNSLKSMYVAQSVLPHFRLTKSRALFRFRALTSLRIGPDCGQP